MINSEGVPASQNPAANLWNRLIDTGFAVLEAKYVKEIEDIEPLHQPEPKQYNRVNHQGQTQQAGTAQPSAFNSLMNTQNLTGLALGFAAVVLGVVLIKKV